MIAEEDGKIVLFRRVREEDLSSEDSEKLPQSVFLCHIFPPPAHLHIDRLPDSNILRRPHNLLSEGSPHPVNHS